MTQVEKIHNEIDTAQDRLLAEAKEIISKFTNSEYADRLEKIGFTGTDIVKKRIPVIQTKEEADTIEHYKQNYPFQKFLTEKEFDRICDKYNLIYAPISAYKKSVPSSNLSDIEMAPELKGIDQPNNIKRCIINLYRYWGGGDTFLSPRSKWQRILPKVIDGNYGFWMDVHNILERKYKTGISYLVKSIKNIETVKQGLFIAAPKSHFNLEGLELSGKGFFNFIISEPKDPIVFRYVNGGIQVITKWGKEANDEGLVNEINN